MNYLSHQAVAESVASESGADARFFVGNVLPDLIATGGGRLRPGDLRDAVPTTPEGQALFRGIRLHFATDARFHSHPAFKEAMAEASALIRSAPFSQPLNRVFFVAHVFVEIALDGQLVGRDPALADRLYAALESVGPGGIADEAAQLLGRPEGFPELAPALHRFLAARYLPSYAAPDGQAEALSRIMARAGVGALLGVSDRAVLADTLAALAPRLEVWEAELLAAPTVVEPPDTIPA